MPADEAAQPVAAGIGPGRDRASVEQPLQIVGQLARRAVASVRLGLQRLHDDAIEVARQAPDQAGRRRPPGVRDRRRQGPRAGRQLPADGRARRRRDPRLDSVRGATRAAGPLSGQQLVENGAEHEDVGGGGHRFTAELFGRGVGRREGAQSGRGRIGQRVVGLEQLGDAEVEQLHFAGARHQDVRRLQIAMDDEGVMRVLGGLADQAKDAQSFVDRQPLCVGMVGHGGAVDVLHHQVGRAFRGVAGVDHAGDVGVREAGQDVALGGEARRAVRSRPSNQLERDRLLVLAVVAFREVDRAHPAVADDIDDTPRAEPDADERIGPGRGCARLLDESFDPERVLRRVGGEHGRDLGAQVTVAAAHAIQVGDALGRRQLERALEGRVEPGPPVGGQGRRHEGPG